MDQKFVVKELEAFHKFVSGKEKSLEELLNKLYEDDQDASQKDSRLLKQKADELAEIAMFFIVMYPKQCHFMDFYTDLIKNSPGMEDPEFRNAAENVTNHFVTVFKENKKLELQPST